MSGADARLRARNDPAKAAKEARERQQAVVESLKKVIDRGHEAIRRSQKLLRMIPDKW